MQKIEQALLGVEPKTSCLLGRRNNHYAREPCSLYLIKLKDNMDMCVVTLLCNASDEIYNILATKTKERQRKICDKVLLFTLRHGGCSQLGPTYVAVCPPIYST